MQPINVSLGIHGELVMQHVEHVERDWNKFLDDGIFYLRLMRFCYGQMMNFHQCHVKEGYFFYLLIY